MQPGEHIGQGHRQPAGQRRQTGQRPDAVEPGEQRPPGGQVHHHVGPAVHADLGAAGGVHRRSPEPLRRDLGLERGLFRRGRRVGHDPSDQLPVPPAGPAAQPERDQLGPEPTGQRLGGTVEVEGRSAGHRPQHVQQPAGDCRLHNCHGIYRNGWRR